MKDQSEKDLNKGSGWVLLFFVGLVVVAFWLIGEGVDVQGFMDVTLPNFIWAAFKVTAVAVAAILLLKIVGLAGK